MLGRLLGAVQFLTVLPVGRKTAHPGQAALFFPFVGFWLGWIGASLYLLLLNIWPTHLSALLVVAFWVVITGTLHEDGLADVADAFRAGRSPERIFAILKDSRIGTYGAAAVLLSVALRWQTIVAIPVGITVRLAAALALSRAVMVALAWIARPAGSGLGSSFAQSLTSRVAVGAILQGVAAALLCGPRLGYALIAANLVLVFAARGYFQQRLGGVSGDCLGATSQISEVCSLLLMTCPNCSW